MASIPLHAIAVARVLVVLDIAQNRRLDRNVEAVALVGAHGHETGTHREAVHLACDRAIHVGNLVLIEVVAGREREVPVLGGLDIAVHAQVLRPTAIILKFLVVERAIAIGASS